MLKRRDNYSSGEKTMHVQQKVANGRVQEFKPSPGQEAQDCDCHCQAQRYKAFSVEWTFAFVFFERHYLMYESFLCNNQSIAVFCRGSSTYHHRFEIHSSMPQPSMKQLVLQSGQRQIVNAQALRKIEFHMKFKKFVLNEKVNRRRKGKCLCCSAQLH